MAETRRSRSLRDAVWVGAAAVVTIVASLLASSGYVWLPLTAFAVFALLILLTNHLVRTMILTAAGCISIIAASGVFIPDDSSTLSIVLRVVGAIFMIAGMLQARSHGFVASPAQHRLVIQVLLTLVIPIGLYIALATVPHSMWDPLFSYTIGLGLMCAVILASGPQLPSGTLSQAIIVALTVTVGLSIVCGVVIPELAIEQARLRGVVNNANLLGFYAFLLGVVALLVVKKPAWRVALFGMSGLALLWTGSRASGLALAVTVAVFMFLKGKATGLFVASGLALVAVCIGLVWPSFFDLFSTITRNNNSRGGSWDVAIEALRLSPLTGVGLGNESSIIASSPLRAAANAGYPGLIVIGILWIAILVLTARIGVRTFAFGLAAVVHSCFEGWLLSPVGPMVLVFALTLCVVANRELEIKARAAESNEGLTAPPRPNPLISSAQKRPLPA
ncbi:O-antigen ligase family protein [Leifsonia sp. NPDC058292]|uniref:O-antigen ligase family protein n=1 Tax=Leifsonia sp. NPDC058292 TaxID=3346428 RepID=UPI0036D95796